MTLSPSITGADPCADRRISQNIATNLRSSSGGDFSMILLFSLSALVVSHLRIVVYFTCRHGLNVVGSGVRTDTESPRFERAPRGCGPVLLRRPVAWRCTAGAKCPVGTLREGLRSQPGNPQNGSQQVLCYGCLVQCRVHTCLHSLFSTVVKGMSRVSFSPFKGCVASVFWGTRFLPRSLPTLHDAPCTPLRRTARATRTQ